MKNPIIATLFIIVLFLTIAGCRRNLVFTYRDAGHGNQFETQQHDTPWKSEEAELHSRATDEELMAKLSRPLEVAVKRVLSGNLILLDNEQIVKYIGVGSQNINNPFYEESKNFNKLMVEGKMAKLQFDLKGRDAEGNMLAYVFVEGMFINAEIIKHGYAKFAPYPQNSQHDDMFLIYENEAVARKKGVWGNGGQ